MTAPAAGWYNDPADGAALRWWDGATWTEHVRPMSEAQVIEPVPTHPPTFGTGPSPISAPTPITPTPITPAPVQAAPAATPPAAAAIPQPGQVAAAPVSGRPVSMTPETPVSDQKYWHSAAAEVIEVPRHHAPMPGSGVGPGAPRNTPSYVRDWNDLGSPHTAGIWLLAAMPLIGIVVNVALQLAMTVAGVTGTTPAIVGSGVVLLLTWVFAALDARALGDRGYHPPRIAWMLLFPPLAYLDRKSVV